MSAIDHLSPQQFNEQYQDVHLNLSKIGPEGREDTTLRAKRGGTTIASLKWYSGGKISWVNVHPDHRGQDVAGAMLRTAQGVEPGLHHDTNLTRSGKKFAARNPLNPGER